MSPRFIDTRSVINSQITNRAIIIYLLALVVVNLLFIDNALMIYWWVFGITEVVIFFLFANRLSKKWNETRITPEKFTKRLFVVALLLRLIYITIVLPFNYVQCGDLFGYENADPLAYDEMAKDLAQCLREGSNMLDFLKDSYGLGSGRRHALAYSDIGFGFYLSFIYYISNDSIVVSRLINCIWGAWTVILIYKLAFRNFGDGSARMAAIFCMLMPNLMYYCATGLKEVLMVFLAMLFVERGDYILRQGKFSIVPVLTLMLIPLVLFTIRTVLAVCLILAFIVALIFSSTRVVGWGRRALVGLVALLFIGVVLMQNSIISQDVRSIADERGSGQKENMEWRATRKDSKGNVQQFAKYAGAAVFAPLIFTIPFPTMVETPGQEPQKMLNGGNFCKNITSFFTVMVLFLLLFSGKWRQHILPISLLCGYLVVLVFSNFAQSERFHQPILPLALMFAAYGIYQMQLGVPIRKHFGNRKMYRTWFTLWLGIMFIAAIAWNWFKLAGRGMV